MQSQMEQWSVLSNIVNYIQYDRHPKNFHNLDIKTEIREIIREGLKQRRETNVRIRFWRHAREIKRIFGYI